MKYNEFLFEVSKKYHENKIRFADDEIFLKPFFDFIKYATNYESSYTGDYKKSQFRISFGTFSDSIIILPAKTMITFVIYPHQEKFKKILDWLTEKNFCISETYHDGYFGWKVQYKIKRENFSMLPKIVEDFKIEETGKKFGI